MKNIFTEIYDKNLWNSEESRSGTGSALSQTKSLISGLEKFISEFHINSILDIPCGDFNWMRLVDLHRVKYTGLDIVNEIVKNNSDKYKSENITFQVADLTTDLLPDADLIICRDCLVHFSFYDIFNALSNLSRVNYKYILVTNFEHRKFNQDIDTGGWRTLNFELYPFMGSKPLYSIKEGCTESSMMYTDKTSSIWSKKDFDKILENMRHLN
jgi:hypothetical protein